MHKLSASAVLLWLLPLAVPAIADEIGLRYGRVFLLLLPGLLLAAALTERWRWPARVRWLRAIGFFLGGLILIPVLLGLGVVAVGSYKIGFVRLVTLLPQIAGGLGKIVGGWWSATIAWAAVGAPIVLPMLVVGALLGRIGQREAPALPIGRPAAVVALSFGLIVQLSHWLVAAIPALLFVALAWTRAKPAESAAQRPQLEPLLLATAGFAAAWLLPTLIDQRASSLFPMPLGVGVLTALAYLLGSFIGPRLDLRLGGAAVLLGLAALWWLGPTLAFLGAILVAAGALALVAAAVSVSWLAPALAALVIGAPQYWRSKTWQEYTPGWTMLAVAAITLLAVTVVLLRRRQAR